MSARTNTSSELELLRLKVTELEAELAKTSPEAYLHAIFDDMFEGIQILDFDFRYIYLNKTAAGHGRRIPEDLLGQRIVDMYPGIDQTEVFHLLQSCMTERISQQMINHFIYLDGRSAWFDLRITPVPMGILVLSVDISAQKGIEEQLRQSQEDLATTLECMAEGVITTDVEGCVTRMNPSAQVLTGWTEKESMGRALDDLVGFLDQNTQSPVDHIVTRILKEGLETGLANHMLLVTRDGSHIPIAGSGAPIRDATGSIRGVVLVLKNMKEEYDLAAMLQRAQKMEALGRLAGGVAHDFNNILTVISGYSEILLRQLHPADPVHSSIEQIKKAGDRAASLTRQLLAFSRQQVLEPRILDLNSIVIDTERMLRRMIGEDISLVTILESHLGRIKADPGQIEQVIMNLSVNARDAMPQGGKLALQTSNVDIDEVYAQTHVEVQPGPYVMLEVSDTGCGMDAPTQARIFEPFFTTKGPGKGTGLGLATVFGIIKQSGGHIWVYSEPGHGTTFKIYFPIIEERVTSPRPAANNPAPGGTETILLVEDDDGVRAITEFCLQMHGYTVIQARGGREALHICETHQEPIHLLISDVIMPEMGGRTVADAVLNLRPDIKVLYVSGYTDDAVVRHGILQEQMAFLQKPFTSDSLAKKVREVLG